MIAKGQINVVIFYANIIAASQNSYFSFSESRFQTVFIAWLNLDIFDGLDAYAKSWLQLAFHAYIISLVISVIVISEYSPRFAKLIGKGDPVATLATLIVLLSYTKILSTVISLYSFTTLHYPNKTEITVWLADESVEFYEAKRITIIAVACIHSSLYFVSVHYSALNLEVVNLSSKMEAS